MIFNLFSFASYTSILRIMTLPPVNNAFYHNFSTQHMSGTFFVSGDDPSVLSELLEEVIKDFSSQASLMAVVHKRHVKVFSQKKFQTCIEPHNPYEIHLVLVPERIYEYNLHTNSTVHHYPFRQKKRRIRNRNNQK